MRPDLSPPYLTHPLPLPLPWGHFSTTLLLHPRAQSLVSSPYHSPTHSAFNAELFGAAKSKSLVLYCASGSRSALAGLTLKELGYPNVRNAGAFRDLKEVVPVEQL